MKPPTRKYTRVYSEPPPRKPTEMLWQRSHSKKMIATTPAGQRRLQIPSQAHAKAKTSTLQMAVFQELRVALSEAAVQYRVFSEHLKMASSKFTEILASQTLTHDHGERSGCDHIIIDDCDEEAMVHLLNVVHLQNRKIPRTLRLGMLTELAALINYYK
jgi:hypothetical protein